MKKSKVLNRAWILSVISLLLCCSMLVGTTYAWFTDGVTSGRNKIVAGNLDVGVKYDSVAFKDDTTSTSTDIVWKPVEKDTPLFSIDPWEPGYTQVVYLEITNNGTLALKYKLSMEIKNETNGIRLNAAGEEESFKLSNYLVFGDKYSEEAPLSPYTNRANAQKDAGDEMGLSPYTDSHVLKPGETDYITLIVYLPEGVGNEVNPIDGDSSHQPSIELGITLEAKQTPDESESDSFDDQYDADATYPNQPTYAVYSPEGTVTRAGNFWEAIEKANVSTINYGELTGVVFGCWEDYELKVGGTYEEGKNLPVTSTSSGTISTDSPVKIFLKNETLYILTKDRDARLIAPADMKEMFRRFAKAKNIVVRGLDTSNVTTMQDAFYNTKIKEINLWGLDLSNVKNMSEIFRGCVNLKKVDLSGMDLANVTKMDRMFAECTNLTEVDLSDVNASRTETVELMFYGCSSLEKVDMNGLNISKLNSMAQLFQGCSKLTTVNMENVNTTSVQDVSSMFQGCASLVTLDMSSFDGSSLNNMGSMFRECTSLTEVMLPTIGNGNSLKTTYMFYNCKKLDNLELEELSGAKITEIEYMLCKCESLTSVDLSMLTISDITSMQGLVADDAALKTILFPDADHLDTAKVESFQYLFRNCSSLETVDISAFNNDSARNIDDSAKEMFIRCSKLETIYASDQFYVDEDHPSDSMFNSCGKLVGGQGTTCKEKGGSSEFARIDDPKNDKPGYFTDVSKKPVDSPAP